MDEKHAAKQKQKILQMQKSLQDKAKRHSQNGYGLFTTRHVTAGTLVILVLIIISFIFFPSFRFGGISKNNSSIKFGSYGLFSIRYIPGSVFAQNISFITQRYSQAGINFGDASSLQYQRMAWQSAFDQTIFYLYAREMLGSAGNRITASFTGYSLQDSYARNGQQFDVEQFRAIPKAQRDAEFNSFSAQLASDRLSKDLDLSKHVVRSAQFLKDISQFGRQTKDASVVFFDETSVSDKTLLAFSQKTPLPFKQISVMKIQGGDLNKALKDLRSGDVKFKDFKASLKASSTAKSSQVNALEQAAGSSQTPSAPVLSPYVGTKVTDSQDMSYYDVQVQYNEKTAKTLFSLGRGAVSDIITAGGVPTIFYIQRAPYSLKTDSPLLLQQVRDYLFTGDRLKKSLKTYVAPLASSFSKAAAINGFDAAVSQNGQELSFQGVPLNFGSSSLLSVKLPSYAKNPLKTSLISSKTFLTALSGTKKGATSAPKLLKGKGYFVLTVTDSSKDALTGDALDAQTQVLKKNLNTSTIGLSGDLTSYPLTLSKTKNMFSDAFYRYFKPSPMRL